MTNGTETPGSTPPPAPEPAAGKSGGGGGRTAALVGLGVILLVGGGVAGYFIGKSEADASGAKKKGVAEGAARVSALYRPGAPGYERIYDAGRAAGSKSGTATGLRLGKKQGQVVGFQAGRVSGKAQGVSDGASAALGEISNWETGSTVFYIVNFNPGGQPGVPYVIQGRHTMMANRLYEICTDDPSQICSQPAPPK
jgi:hypothetical protein